MDSYRSILYRVFMGLPARYRPHYTVEDYEQWSGDWELWSGTAVSMSPSPKKIHQRLSKRLVTLLDEALRNANCESCEALQEVDWRVSHDTVFRPDLFIACSDEETDYIEHPPRFIAEILSESTREKDRHFKREAYQALGVGYYMMVDPEDSTIVFLELIEGEYREKSDLEEVELILDEECKLSLRLTRLFD